jgi:hypothetical protein
MYCNNSGGACFFFDIDVKGGESVVISRMLQWYSWMFFKGLPSMPKGEIVGMFSDRGRVCVFVIDGKDHDQQRRDNGMAMASSTVKSNSDRWIPFRFPDDRQI